jgi:hypothetical protein
MSTATERYSVTKELAERHRGNVIEADELLREICQSGRRPTFAELTFCQREIGWDAIAVNTQLRRMKTHLFILVLVTGCDTAKTPHSSPVADISGDNVPVEQVFKVIGIVDGDTIDVLTAELMANACCHH